MKRIAIGALFACLFVANLFGQTGSAHLDGIVNDPTKALIPGVVITATNVDTGVVTTQISNDSGAYNFAVLQPGVYEISAELNGFKKSIQKNVNVPSNGQLRIDFTMELSQGNQSVEVVTSLDTSIKETSASIGTVLNADKIQSLPLVGGNILDLLSTLPGIRSSEAGTAFDTINGLGTNSLNATRDGMQINDTRNPASIYGTRILSDVTLNPDLVGEIRLILSPVDAELGHGNSQIQISTRSGTNKYSGAASWNVRNSALDANTWTNNHTPFTDPSSGVASPFTPKTWNNVNQYTISYGGPIKIPKIYDGKNKTFFFVLWNQNLRNTREPVSTNVMTDTARQGIFRYFEGYNPLGYQAATPTFPQVATSATWVAVDQNGNPVSPLAAPTSPTANPAAAGFIPYTSTYNTATKGLICFSVFGNQKLSPSGGMAPFVGGANSPDCPGGMAVVPSGSSGQPTWDKFRPAFDTSGLIQKFLANTPHATYFGGASTDGLNVGAVRWVRGRSGTNDATNGLVGTVNLANYKQINVKIDHNFSAKHKVSFGITRQWDNSADNAPGYPDGIYGELTRSPYQLTANDTLTLNGRMVNEARFGVTYTLNQDVQPWESSNSSLSDTARSFMMPAGVSTLNPNFAYLALVNSGVGNISNGNGFMNTAAAGNYQKNETYDLADNFSWSLAKHSLKFGVEYRMPRTSGTGASQSYPTVNLGNASAGATPSPFATTATFGSATDPVGFLPGLLNAGTNTSRTNATNLLQYLNGSVASVSQNYWITGASNIANGVWDDQSTQGDRIRKQINYEWSAFAKDDYKVTRNLTLNLGLRWDFYSSPYIAGGFTSIFVDQGYGAFGATRTAQTTLADFNSNPFNYFLRPGNLYLANYGSLAGQTGTSPLSCVTGVQQNALLPVSNCDPASLSTIEFVGPDSPNPNKVAVPQNWNNFGPAVGFAYSLPFFGEGKTTIRGGYQQTFGNGSTNRSALNGGTEATLANAPGAVTAGTLSAHINDAAFSSILATRAINLTDINLMIPAAPTVKPGQSLQVYSGVTGPGAGVNWNVYDPKLQTPYAQNITLSVNRQINNRFTLDVSYIGTLGRKQMGSIDINQNNIYYNPEMFQALTDARAGTCTANAAAYQANYTSKGINPCDASGDPVILDQMLAGLNLNTATSGTTGTGSFGAVGTVNTANIYQTGAQQLRKSATFQNALSFGDFNGVANSLLGLAPTTAQGKQNAPIDPATAVTITGVSFTGMRNSCDRMANGAAFVQQTVTFSASGVPTVAFNPGFNASNATPLRCFSEDYLHANPQFGNLVGFGTASVIYNSNTARSTYHSLQTQLTARPIQGASVQTTLTWAKSMNVPGSGYIDPSNRNLNYGAQAVNGLSLRMNGTFELPVGPNKLLFGNTTGWVARAIERWQTSFIFNSANGTPATLNPGQSHFYAPSGYDIASTNWKIPSPHLDWVDGTNTGWIYPQDKYTSVTDPSCFDPTTVTMGDKMGTVLGRIGTGTTATGPCTILALAAKNPDGTPGEVLLKYPAPGKVGNLGRGNFQYFGQWTLDMSISKAFRITERNSLQIRFDGTDILNHPVPNVPTLGASAFGQVNGKGAQVRSFQGQLRFTF